MVDLLTNQIVKEKLKEAAYGIKDRVMKLLLLEKVIERKEIIADQLKLAPPPKKYADMINKRISVEKAATEKKIAAEKELKKKEEEEKMQKNESGTKTISNESTN